MAEIEPLIKREIEKISLGRLETIDLSALVLAKVRRRKLRRLSLILVAGVVGSLFVAGLIYGLSGSSIFSHSKNESAASSTTVKKSNAEVQPAFTGLISDYPITWEQSVGDTGAISKAGGLGDSLSGLTARGLKVSWERCGKGQCPITWTLSVVNETQDLISVNAALMIFVDHQPLISTSRPTTVTPGASSILVYTFPEFKDSLPTTEGVSWQWNWFLKSAN